MSNHFDNFHLPNNDVFPFQVDSNVFDSNSSSPNNHFNSNGVQQNSCLKETGIIEKMLVSYGFIQCCERQARLFFHFSQFLGKVEHLKIGDPVEYETSYDKRTGKPVAINLKKITSNDFMIKLTKTERLNGVIATEITNDREGRVAFENMGEFFFLPFKHDDKTVFKANDKVSFILTIDESGSYRASSLQLEESNVQNYQGVISVVKDTFGFIERSDSMSKIFFHSSDCSNFKSLSVGDFVEFNVATRKNKELAINVSKLENTDEDYSDKIYRGKVTKYNSRSNLASGLIYCYDLKKEFFFHDKDVKGTFTLNSMDYVTFRIATDRRNHYERAIQISFLSDTFELNSEIRDKGYVASLKESYGFIKCPSKEGSLIYFKMSELLDPSINLKLNDEVEFTYLTDSQNKKCQAIRISILPNGTLFNNILLRKSIQHNNAISSSSTQENLVDLNFSPSPKNQQSSNNHHFESLNDTHQNDYFGTNGNLGNGKNDDNLLNIHDNENFLETFINKNKNVSLLDIPLEKSDHSDIFSNCFESNGNASKHFGIIVVLKENYGFIESLDGDKEYYFQNWCSTDEKPKLGQSVEFTPDFINNKWKALNVVPAKLSAVNHNFKVSDKYFIGVVHRTLQMFNSEQKEYTGLIINSASEQKNAWNDSEQYEFSMISLKFLKDYISPGDLVKFQIGTHSITKKCRAFNVEVVRERLRGTIYSLQAKFGFLKPEALFIVGNIYFNAAEIRNNSKLKVGDKVDFYLINNKKTDKYYAIDINKVEESSNNNLSTNVFKNLKTNENGPKVIAIRQPKAPDGSRGFTR